MNSTEESRQKLEDAIAPRIIGQPASGPVRNKNREKPKAQWNKLRLLILSSILLLAIAIALIPAVVGFDRTVNDERLNVDSTVAGMYGFSTADYPQGELTPFGSGLVINCLDTEIQVLNISGVPEYSLRVFTNQPRIISDDHHAFVYDLGGTYYCMLSPGGPVFEGRTEDVIQGAYRSSDGLTALILDRFDTRGVLQLLNPDGEMLLEWTSRSSENSGYLLSVSFAPDNSFIDLSLMNTDGAYPRPVILRLSLDRRKLGEELLRLQPNIRTSLPQIAHTTDGNLWMTDGRTIYSYHPENGNTVIRYNFSDIHSFESWDDVLVVTGTYPGREGVQLYLLTGELADVEHGLSLSSGARSTPRISSDYLTVSAGRTVSLLEGHSLHGVKLFELPEVALKTDVDKNGDVVYITRSWVGLIEN